MSEVNCIIKDCNKKAEKYLIITRKTIVELVTDKGYIKLSDVIEKIPLYLCDEHFKLFSKPPYIIIKQE
jgi:hypothetical protein